MKAFLPFAVFAALAALVVAARHQSDPDTILDSRNGLADPCRHQGGFNKREVGNKASQSCDKILDTIGDICKKYFSDDGGEDDDDDTTGWVFKYL